MVDNLVFGTPRSRQGDSSRLAPLSETPTPKVVAYLSDVFEAPRLKDQMQQYDKVMKNLAKQKSYNEESCKRDMRYHRKRYETIYDEVRASPQSLPPLRTPTSIAPSVAAMSENPPNSDIYVDTRRGKPGDHSLFKADWRVLKSEFPPKSGYNSAVRRQQLQMIKRSGKSGRSRDVTISWNNPTPEVGDEKQRLRTFIAPGGYFESSVNNDYGSTVVKTPNLESLYSTPRYASPARPSPTHATPSSVATSDVTGAASTSVGSVTPSMSERRYKPPSEANWKSEAWKRANLEYRRYRDATNLSGVPVNRRISNFEFGGHMVIG